MSVELDTGIQIHHNIRGRVDAGGRPSSGVTAEPRGAEGLAAGNRATALIISLQRHEASAPKKCRCSIADARSGAVDGAQKVHGMSDQTMEPVQHSVNAVRATGTLPRSKSLLMNPLTLQALAGNAAVSRLLESDGSHSCRCCGGGHTADAEDTEKTNSKAHCANGALGPTVDTVFSPVQREDQPSKSSSVKFGPVVTGRSEAEVRARFKAAKEFLNRYPGVGRSFVDLAFSAAQNGARTAAKPPDPVAKENFDRALAGNLLWAATSLFATWHPAVILMSFVGAAMGTGVGKRKEADFGLGEKMIADRLSQEADSFEARLKTDWDPVLMASMFVAQSSNPDDYEAQDRYIWRMLLPKVPWESKREAITNDTRTRASRALGDFLRQWMAWTASIERCSKWKPVGMDNDPHLDIASMTSGRKPVQAIALPVPTVQMTPFLFPPVIGRSKSQAACEAENPFNPQLHFV